MKCKLSIYLAKVDSSDNSILIDTSHMKKEKKLNIPETDSVIYINQEKPEKYPDWVGFVVASSFQQLNLNDFVKCQSEGAILISSIQGRKFLISFGSGHHKINKESIERDFGLRVTINSVDPNKLRSLDKSNYQDTPLNTRSQSSKEVDILSLNIDSELEILATLTGKSNEPIFGETVTGRDNLGIIIDDNLNNLGQILSKALEKYNSKLPIDFQWIDNIAKVKDIIICEVLDLELDSRLESNDYKDDFWLGEPEIVDWETQVGYAFDLYSNSPIYPVLSLNSLKKYLERHGVGFNCEGMKKQKIHIINENEKSFKAWSAYLCLYAELKLDKEQYVLRNGVWYQIASNFENYINTALNDIKKYNFNLPIYNHDREDEYNAHVASSIDNIYLMDKGLISHGGKSSKFEFADLIREAREIIHVKYYRSSSTLSHLFSQGLVSAELFTSDKEFRRKLNNKLPDEIKLKNYEERPDTGQYTIVYAIATNKEIPHGLPFFSKITLKNTVKSLNTLGFKVRISRVNIDPLVEIKKLGKTCKK